MRPALFALDAERAHELTIAALQWPAAAGALRLLSRGRPAEALRQHVFGLTFDHPIGLAAGLDKQGAATAAWAALGFAFVEVGTVTPRPQPGNPRPRLFRLRDDRAIINRFGFNSEGAAGVARNLGTGGRPRIRLGINVGRNKDTSNDQASDDYQQAIEILRPFAHYFVVNVSSPNTAGLRDLQESAALRRLMADVVVSARNVPVLVKVSPDMQPDDLVRSVEAAAEGGAAGVVATNTTIGRAGLRTRAPLAQEAGGLSGAPLRRAANESCRLLFRQFGRRLPIIGVGGIFTADDAYERIRAGATLVQLYTALIYEGPGVVQRILRGLAARVARDGFSSITDAVGADA